MARVPAPASTLTNVVVATLVLAAIYAWGDSGAPLFVSPGTVLLLWFDAILGPSAPTYGLPALASLLCLGTVGGVAGTLLRARLSVDGTADWRGGLAGPFAVVGVLSTGRQNHS